MKPVLGGFETQLKFINFGLRSTKTTDTEGYIQTSDAKWFVAISDETDFKPT